MNYNYQSEQNQPQQNPNGLGYSIVIGGPPQNQPPPEQYQLSPQQIQDIHYTKIRQALAHTRLSEAELMLGGMREIRQALNLPRVAEGDTGAKDRPPLEPAFNAVNLERLQGCYLRMAERVVNHIEQFLSADLRMELTNEIKRDANFKAKKK